ncbi:MAG: DUF11 domain-containing protein [Planctomycetes bacterium]|nr:DUF11 domain-containing protein [Planctomycetota bacterium]
MTRIASAFLATLALLIGCASSEKSPEPAREAPAAESRSSDGLHWTERAYPTGDRRTSVVVLESGTPAEVSAGTRYEYVLRVTNLTDQNLDNVVVLDKPQGNFQLSGSRPQTEDGRNLRWNLGSLRGRQAKEITVTGSALGAGHVTHCAEVDWNSVFCSTTQVVKPALTISSTATAAILVCDPIVRSVTVSNSGTGTTRNIVIEERLPDGISTLEGKSNVSHTLLALEPGESKTFSWREKAARTGRYSSVASARADGGLSARSGEAWTTVTRPVLVLEKQGTKKTYRGRTIAYDMTLRNTGDGEARDVVVTENLPADTKFVQASEGGTLDGGVVRWRLGSMAPGAARTFNMRISSEGAARVRSTTTANAYCADAVSATAETDVTGIAAILLEVKDLDDPIELGGVTTYLITVTNQGSTPDTNIQIVVDLEDTMGYVSSAGSTKADQVGRRVTFRPLASLAAGEKAEWRVEVKAVSEGDVRIRVAMTSNQRSRPVEETESTTFFK